MEPYIGLYTFAIEYILWIYSRIEKSMTELEKQLVLYPLS